MNGSYRQNRFLVLTPSKVIIIITKSRFDPPGGKLKSMRTRLFVFAALGTLVSVPTLRAQGLETSTVTLSVEHAIAKAIETNLTTHLAQAASTEARGRVLQAAASLLPQLTGTLSQERVFKLNLAAEGFTSSPLIPNAVIGPFNVFDARIQLVQNLLDLTSIWLTKAASANVRVARLTEDLVAEQVASAAALAYIEDLRAIRDVQDAQANLELSEKLSTLAHHQHAAGLATAVDLARADTRVAVDNQNLIQVQLTAYQADIRLKRVVGLPLPTNITLAETEDAVPKEGPEEASALAQAQSDRFELRITQEQLKAETYALDAAKAGFFPTLAARADYGFSGNTPDSTARTGSIGGSLDLPILSGGLTRGQIKEAQGRQSAAQSQYDDTRIQVEEDVRLALHALSAEVDEVKAADTKVQLAERELQLSQNRYSAGLGDNVEVVTAQASLADARKSRVDARARYADARANLAIALGHMRTFSL